jgi:hypothetical protein
MDNQSDAGAFEYEDILKGDALADGQIDEILQGFTPSDEAPRAPFSADADAAQRAFIEARSQTIRLLAPAGSGKTQSIANRVARCVSDGMKPDDRAIVRESAPLRRAGERSPRARRTSPRSGRARSR